MTDVRVVLDAAQTISFGADLPTTFADSLRGLIASVGVPINALVTTPDGSADYLLRGVTTDEALTRDGEPHLIAIRSNSEGVPISRAVDLIPTDEILLVHVY